MLPQTAQTTRVTRSGKSITYTLKVLQQPERARACGSGAKSSADRRPIDPPPIVELQLSDRSGADLTFAHDASFFLFVTLENYLPPSNGGAGQTAAAAAAAATSPVLTGATVAGIAYLDRPAPAGYFIFPDLSVRNEGQYRLRFALFEDTKSADEADPADTAGTVARRLDVLSRPFTVFSAKKFPGLTESTKLSRIVAEQGCRVRIRRDIRVRRRDKPVLSPADDVDGPGEKRRGPGSPLTPVAGYSFPPTAPIQVDSGRPGRFAADPITPDLSEQGRPERMDRQERQERMERQRAEWAARERADLTDDRAEWMDRDRDRERPERVGKRAFTDAFDLFSGPVKMGMREGQMQMGEQYPMPTSAPMQMQMPMPMTATAVTAAAAPVPVPGRSGSATSITTTATATTPVETLTMSFRRADGRVSSLYMHKTAT